MSKRKSGILLHITSLPNTPGIGTMGAEAYHFVDWLKEAGQGLWQVLPLGPTGYGDSPYASFSTFAGNPLIIDLDDLVSRGWASPGDIVPPEYIKNEGKVDLEPLVTKTFSFEKYLDAYKFIDEHREEAMKIIINVQE